MDKDEKLEILQEAFAEYAFESMADALSFADAMLVGLCELAAKQQGIDPALIIEIPGDANHRKITIHPLEETE